MEKDNNQLKISMYCSNQCLSLHEEASINISITNTSHDKIENGLFKLLLNTDYIEILDEKVKICIHDFASIGSINSRQTISMSIPIKVIKIPKDNTLYISSFLNYHIIKNDTLIDQNYESPQYEIKLYNLNILSNENFIINSFKKEYLIDEDIYCFLTLKNNKESNIENLEIKNFIPSLTQLVEDSIISNNPENLSIKDNIILLKNLNIDEEINIKYKLNIDKDAFIENISITPILSYKCHNLKKVNVNADILNIDIKSKEFFNSNSFKHSIDKDNVSNGELIEHTVFIKNNTDTYISNLVLTENMPIELDFIKDSLIVNSINRVEEDLLLPIKLGDIEPNEEIIIKFKTIANGEFKSIEFNSNLNYDTNRRSIIQRSNHLKINIIGVIFNDNNFVKEIDIKDKSISIGDVINYKIKILNTGNIAATNIIIKDILPKQIKFIEESVEINSLLKPGGNIEKGVLLDCIKPNEKIIISYKALAKDICTDKSSSAQLFYTYSKLEKVLTLSSNSVNITIKGAKIGQNNFIKESNTNSCQIGDLITTRLTIENTGNIHCESIKICDKVNSALEFIEDSLRIDGASSTDNNIFEGINISSLKVGQRVSITYQVKIIGYPRPNPIDDRASLTYTYIKDSKLKTREIYSTRNKVYINNPKLIVTDTNSNSKTNPIIKCIAYNDYIFYNLYFQNTGNVGIEDINVKLVLPTGIDLKKDSITINNHTVTGDIEDGMKIPNLNVSQVLYLSFYAKHNFGNDYELDSCVYIDYSFRDLQTKAINRKSAKVKEVILVAKPDIEITKFISDEDIELDREFTKNINIKNTGNVVLNNIFVDLNESEFLRQCDNTLYLNGNYIENTKNIYIEKIDVNETINIAIRYNLKYIPLCESILDESIVTGEYYLVDNSEPIQITKKSNKLKLNIKNYNLIVDAKCHSDIIALNESNNFIFTVTNIGNVSCENTKIMIPIPANMQYIEESLTLNGKKIPDNTFKYGVDLGSLNYNETITVGFDFKVIKLPTNNTIGLTASIKGQFLSQNKVINKTFKSHTKDLKIESINMEIIKSVSHEYLQSGDILKIYTIIRNNGNISLDDISIMDNYDNNLLFIENSVTIDGNTFEEANPLNGFYIEKLNIEDSIMISYEYEYKPKISNTKITHFSNLTYSCISTKNNSKKSFSTKSNTIYVEGALSTFKQFNIEKEHTLKNHDPNIGEIVSVFSDAKVDTFYQIDSIKNRSYDNINSTGKKAIVKGFVVDRIEYLTADEDNALYMLTIEEPFTSFVNLPDDYDNENIYFKARCEDVFYKLTSDRNIFVSSLILIEGTM